MNSKLPTPAQLQFTLLWSLGESPPPFTVAFSTAEPAYTLCYKLTQHDLPKGNGWVTGMLYQVTLRQGPLD